VNGTLRWTDRSWCKHTNTKEPTVANRKETSPKAAKAASKVLRDGRTSKASKTAAGSALAQASKRKK
jgi:hypothetical protein